MAVSNLTRGLSAQPGQWALWRFGRSRWRGGRYRVFGGGSLCGM